MNYKIALNPCPSLRASDFPNLETRRPELAGVMRLINQDHTNTSRKPNKHYRARPDTNAEADKQTRTKSRSQAKSQGCDV